MHRLMLPTHEAKFPALGSRSVIFPLQIVFPLKKLVQFCDPQRDRFPRGRMFVKPPRKVPKNPCIIGPKAFRAPVGVPVLKIPVTTHLRRLVNPVTMLSGLQRSIVPPRQVLMPKTSLKTTFMQLVAAEAPGARTATTTRKAKP